MQRAARKTAQTPAQLDWRAYALTFYAKNMHTLTAKNQANPAQDAIICDGSETPNSAGQSTPPWQNSNSGFAS
jgi:hypothetical protein